MMREVFKEGSIQFLNISSAILFQDASLQVKEEVPDEIESNSKCAGTIKEELLSEGELQEPHEAVQLDPDDPEGTEIVQSGVRRLQEIFYNHFL